MAQQLAHHTVSGCNVRVGDLMGSGTISGTTPDSYGSLLELTRNGAEPVTLHSGAKRGFTEDGDEVVMRGWCRATAIASASARCVAASCRPSLPERA